MKDAVEMLQHHFDSVKERTPNHPDLPAMQKMIDFGDDWVNLSIDRLRSMDQFKEIYSLTNREAEILELVLNGRTESEIGEVFCISPRTVGNHKSSIYNKVGLNNAMEVANLFWKLSSRLSKPENT